LIWTITSSHSSRAPSSRARSISAREQPIPYSFSSLRGNDADTAEPRSFPTDAEVGKPDRLVALQRDERAGEIEIERVDHEAHRRLVDLEGDEVALVGGGEDLRELAELELAQGAQVHRCSSATAVAASPSPRPVKPR
jgi:hypothetical protein